MNFPSPMHATYPIHLILPNFVSSYWTICLITSSGYQIFHWACVFLMKIDEMVIELDNRWCRKFGDRESYSCRSAVPWRSHSPQFDSASSTVQYTSPHRDVSTAVRYTSHGGLQLRYPNETKLIAVTI
jgi:hypothetical protein